VQAHGDNGQSSAFAVRPRANGFEWIRLRTGGIAADNLSVAGIDRNGDIDGGLTVDNPDGSFQLRSVIWKSIAGGSYGAAQLLPMSRGFSESISGGIWYRNGVPYVAGAQGNPATQVASLWSPSPELTSLSDERPFVSTIGGATGHVYAAGTTFWGSISYAWLARVTFDKSGTASLQGPVVLPPVHGFDQAYGGGVGLNAAGQPVVVGDVASDGPTFAVSGAEWVDGRATLLQTLVADSPWSISGVAGINQSGEMAADGTKQETQQAVLLKPAHSG